MTTQTSDIVLLGATSILGWNLVSGDKKGRIKPICHPLSKHDACASWDKMNLDSEEAYREFFSKSKPQTVIYSAGICDVDSCEQFPERAKKINVEGVRYFLKYLPKETRLIYISSDHVFGGRDKPYTEDSVPEPISVYGRTRVQSEMLVWRRKGNTLILRFALGLGPSIDGKSGHLDWLKYRTKKKLPMTIVEDEFRSVVWAKDLAERVLVYADSNITGLRHITASRALSRLELAHYLNKKYKIGAKFTVKSRFDMKAPHLGRVELKTIYSDDLSMPLPPI